MNGCPPFSVFEDEVTGLVPPAAPVPAIVLEGECTAHGAAGTFRLTADSDGRFLLVIESALPERLGFDGTTAWAVDWSGMPRSLGPGESRAERVGILAWTRRFIASSLLEAGRATLDADSTSGIPRTLRRTGLEGSETWTFEGSIDAEGLPVPRFVRVTVDGEATKEFEVTRATRFADSGSDSFSRPTGRPRDIRFDPAASSRIPITRARTGHVLTKVSIDGNTPAWFILDTGAGGSAILDSSLGARLPGASLGTVPAIGVLGVMHMNVRRAASLRVGPLTIEHPFILEQDLSFLSPIHDEPVLGILGYDLFSRVVATIELGEDSIEIHDPAAPPESLAWEPLTLELCVPLVPGGYEGGRRGLFRIDIGAAGPGFGNVAFHSPTVRNERLLEGRSLQHAQLGADPISFGVLDYFEMGGCRFEAPTVVFAGAETGPLSDADTAGNLGVDFLKAFRLVLDYPRGRFAFARKECPKWTNAGHPHPERTPSAHDEETTPAPR